MPEHRDRRRLCPRQHRDTGQGGVAHQHRPGGRDLAGQGRSVLGGGRVRDGRGDPVQGPHPGRDQRGAPLRGRAGHDEVLRRVRRGLGAAHGRPVRADDPVARVVLSLGIAAHLDMARTIRPVDVVRLDPALIPAVTGRRALASWMVVAYLVTFLVTGPSRTPSAGGAGRSATPASGACTSTTRCTASSCCWAPARPSSPTSPTRPGPHVLAALFGVGAALTLDEFALWLHLDDVYWSREGRSSVDAVLVALVVGCLLLVGVNPFDGDQAAGEAVVALTVVVNLLSPSSRSSRAASCSA